MPHVHRRALIAAGVATGALTPAVASSPERATAAAGRSAFRHGVASGDPLPDAVVIWTRVTPIEAAAPGSGQGPAVRVGWEVSRDRGFRRVVARGTSRTTALRDHTVHVDVRGLRPGTRYWYRFTWGGARSQVGRTRTAPARRSRVPVRLGVVSCANYNWGHFSGYRHLARRDDLDAVLHLGDYIYEYGPDGPLVPGVAPATVRVAEPPRECVTLADYRIRYGCYRRDRALQAMHAAHPVVAVWDDHEIANDTWREGAENHDEGEGPWQRRAREARQAWLEWLPVRHVDPDDPERINRRLRFGAAVDLWMLDERRFRDEPPRSLAFSYGSVDPGTGPDRSMLGDAQRHWLGRGLRRSDAWWKVLGNQVPFFPLVIGAGVPEAIQAVLEPISERLPHPSTALYVDDWNGFKAEREHLVAGIAEVEDVVVLTGDVHQSMVSDIPRDPGTYRIDPVSVAAEFITPGIGSPSLRTSANSVMPGSGEILETILNTNLAVGNPWAKYDESEHCGYLVVDFDRRRAHADYFHLDNARDPHSGVKLGASWECRRGSRRVTPARRGLDT